MERYIPIIKYALLYYDADVYRLGWRPLDNGRLMASVYFTCYAVQPITPLNQALSTAKKIIKIAKGIRPSLVRERSKSIIDRAEEIGAATLNGLEDFGKQQDKDGEIAEPMQLLSSLYQEALAESASSEIDSNTFMEITGHSVSASLVYWSVLRKIIKQDLLETEPFSAIACKLIKGHLIVPKVITDQLKMVEKKMKKGFGSNVTTGQYPVPYGQVCLFCDEPAVGSVGNDNERHYLCMKHLRKIGIR